MQLRGINQSVDVSQLTVENALFKSFDTIVRMQLQPIWHRTSKRTRALCEVRVGPRPPPPPSTSSTLHPPPSTLHPQDLVTLRKLLNFLVSYDCVSYASAALHCHSSTAAAQ